MMGNLGGSYADSKLAQAQPSRFGKTTRSPAPLFGSGGAVYICLSKTVASKCVSDGGNAAVP